MVIYIPLYEPSRCTSKKQHLPVEGQLLLCALPSMVASVVVLPVPGSPTTVIIDLLLVFRYTVELSSRSATVEGQRVISGDITQSDDVVKLLNTISVQLSDKN